MQDAQIKEETIKFQVLRPQADSPIKDLDSVSEKTPSNVEDVKILVQANRKKSLKLEIPADEESSSSSDPDGDGKSELKERSKCWNISTMLTVALGGYFFGYFVVITTVLGIPLTKGVYKYGVAEQDSMTGNFASLFALGGFISVIFFGKLTNLFGRVKLTIYIEILALSIILLSTFKNIYLFLVLRLLTGFVAGVNLVLLPIYCRELFPQKLASAGATRIRFCYTFHCRSCAS